MRTESYGDPAMEELAAARDSDELCRLLVQSPWGWGSSTRHGEAVSLLRGLRGGTLPGSLVALLLCTCRRWDRVTAKLIAAVEDCGVLSGPDLDELAESLLSDEVVAVFPLAWISGQWLELGTADGTTRTVQVSDEAMARDERRVEPPLRRWAAARALEWWSLHLSAGYPQPHPGKSPLSASCRAEALARDTDGNYPDEVLRFGLYPRLKADVADRRTLGLGIGAGPAREPRHPLRTAFGVVLLVGWGLLTYA